ncbi:MAG: FAD-binding protein, partial [Leptospiraceae bacterium]|nr:FAD-binding protein [Leptospiraceae bacterium]
MTEFVFQELNIENNRPLAPLTTIGLGGAARYYCALQSPRQLPVARRYCEQHQLPVFVLGGGSNVVFADGGFAGLVLHVAWRGIDVKQQDAQVSLRVAAGEPWDEFVAHCVARGWGGVECLSGIPGSTGATPVQNVGAYGQEVADCIVAVECFDWQTNSAVTFTREECRFAYRDSRFKSSAEKGRFIITHVQFQLSARGPLDVRYGELSRRLLDRLEAMNSNTNEQADFRVTRASESDGQAGAPHATGTEQAGRSSTVSVDTRQSQSDKERQRLRELSAHLSPVERMQTVRAEVLRLRSGKSMVIDPEDPDTRSCGSFFMNPELSADEFAALKTRINSNARSDNSPETRSDSHGDSAADVAIPVFHLPDMR